MKRCLVTGSSGFVGASLCRHLSSLGMEVIGLDVRPAVGVVTAPACFVPCNLATGEGLEDVNWDCLDAVFHLAAAGVKAASRDWPVCVQVNILGTLRLLEWLDQSGSAATLVYTHTFYEDFVPSTPALVENPYVLSKYATSRLVRQFASHYAGAVVTAKLFQIYGPGDAPGNLIPYAIACLRKGEAAKIGSGAGLRDWLHIADLIAGLVAAGQAGVPGRLREFDLGSGQLVSIRDVLIRLATFLCKPVELLNFDASRDRGDTALAGRAQMWPDNWHPVIGLERGLRQLVDASKDESAMPGQELSSGKL